MFGNDSGGAWLLVAGTFGPPPPKPNEDGERDLVFPCLSLPLSLPEFT